MNGRRFVESAVLMLCLMGALAVAGQCKVVYVKPTGDDANAGLSWELAKRTVSSGLSTAAPGDEVWVARGTYFECVVLKDGVALYGGFAGNETQREQRNWQANATILDGNQSGSVVTSPDEATPATRIDGFRIRNGKAEYGGGVYCSKGSPTIVSNTISANSAKVGGGILYVGYPGSATISNNYVTENTAKRGGGIYCDLGSPTINGNIICANSADLGGGILCGEGRPTVTNNTITGNSAENGGGIYCEVSAPTISNNIVAFNTSGIVGQQSSGALRNNCVYGNAEANYKGLQAGGTDISRDPLFVNRQKGDYHLKGESPCVDAGWNKAPGLPSVDVDGKPRTQGRAIDMGALEFQPPAGYIVQP